MAGSGEHLSVPGRWWTQVRRAGTELAHVLAEPGLPPSDAPPPATVDRHDANDADEVRGRWLPGGAEPATVEPVPLPTFDPPPSATAGRPAFPPVSAAVSQDAAATRWIPAVDRATAERYAVPTIPALADAHLEPAAPTASYTPYRRALRSRRLAIAWGIPAAVVAASIVAALAIAGVFTSASPSSPSRAGLTTAPAASPVTAQQAAAAQAAVARARAAAAGAAARRAAAARARARRLAAARHKAPARRAVTRTTAPTVATPVTAAPVSVPVATRRPAPQRATPAPRPSPTVTAKPSPPIATTKPTAPSGSPGRQAP